MKWNGVCVINPHTPFFFEMGMHCLDCPVSRMESIEDACDVHGVDMDELIAKLNEYFNAKKN